MTPKRFFALALVVVCAFAATSATAASTERLPVTCYAVWGTDGSLRVTVRPPDWPGWIDIVPAPPPAMLVAEGTATFSSDKVSVDCHGSPWPLLDRSFWSTPYAKRGPAYSAREQTPDSYILRMYSGTGTASVSRSDERITAQLHLDYSNWP